MKKSPIGRVAETVRVLVFEAHRQADYALRANMDLLQYQEEKDLDNAFRLVDNVATHCARLSYLIWPKTVFTPSPKKAEKVRSFKFRVLRGRIMQRFFEVDIISEYSGNPEPKAFKHPSSEDFDYRAGNIPSLRDKRLRNFLMHIDERHERHGFELASFKDGEKRKAMKENLRLPEASRIAGFDNRHYTIASDLLGFSSNGEIFTAYGKNYDIPLFVKAARAVKYKADHVLRMPVDEFYNVVRVEINNFDHNTLNEN